MYICYPKRVLLFVCTIFVVWPAFAFAQAAGCAQEVAKLVSVIGQVEACPADEDMWHSVQVEETFCPGDKIRIGPNSNTVVVLGNHTLVRLSSLSSITFKGSKKESFWIEMLKGIAYFISRLPRTLEVTTPFVNAGVRGTEFLVKVDENETLLTVFEGVVQVYNDAGTLSLLSGQSAVTEKDVAPVIRILVRPRDLVQWALYYPPVLQFNSCDFQGYPETAWQSKVARSIDLYRQGKLSGAFAALEDMPEDVTDSRLFTYSASLSLAVGMVTKAKADIDRALALQPDNGEALSLMAVIAVAQNDKDHAMELANRAVAASPGSAGALLALSYAWQAKFQLEDALAAMEKAVDLAPDNALAWSRLAELHLMFRDLNSALKAAQKAEGINPNLNRTQTVLGYAHLIYLNTEAAKQAFRRAIALNQAEPLARLGLGLASIYEGSLEEGRREIEIAAALDPGNALIRSYLGKAYYEEKRDHLAGDQYEMAKMLDPLDPTSFFYDAIRKQADNRLVESFHDIRKSISLNDSRAVYRSRLLLDEDLAARGVSLARIYTELGFRQLALVEGWKSMNLNPGNHSAHQLLADSYAGLPRHDIARVSELLQSQLLQPVNINPVSPRLAETNLFIQEQAGPASAAFNEFNPLFFSERFALQINSIIGNNNTLGDELLLLAQKGRLSFSLGQFHHETDGFRKNNDIEHDIYNAFAQLPVSHNISLQFELRRREIDNGDLSLLFDANIFSPYFRQDIDQDAARIGLNYRPGPGHIFIFSAIYNDKTDKQAELFASPGNPKISKINFFTQAEGLDTELQHQYLGKTLKMVTGIGYADLDEENRITIDQFENDIFLASFTHTDTKGDVDKMYAYLYANLSLDFGLTASFGLSYDDLDQPSFSRDQLNPKLGLIWNVTADTTLRAAAFRTMNRSNQTIEPTQIAGFNQFFDNTDGTDARRYGIGLDHHITSSLYCGIELTKRELKRYIAGEKGRREDQYEKFHRAYIYWAPTLSLGLSAEYQFEDFDRQFIAGMIDPWKPASLTTHVMPLKARLFFTSCFFGDIQTSYVRQEIKLVADSGVEENSDDFWITDISFGYRFPKRMGLVSVGICNIFKESFSYQSTNFETGLPRPPRFQPDRGIYAKVNLWF